MPENLDFDLSFKPCVESTSSANVPLRSRLVSLALLNSVGPSTTSPTWENRGKGDFAADFL